MTDQLISFIKDEPVQAVLGKIARFIVNSRVAASGIGGWVHSLAVKFNDPQSPAIAALRFENYMNAEIHTFLESSDAKDIKGLKQSDIVLTGNGALANAFKKIKNAMMYGGDLCADEGDNACPTISKCAQYAKKQKAIKDKADTAEAARKDIHAKLVSQGLEPGSDEFEKQLAFEMSLLLSAIGDDTGKGKPNEQEDEAKDEWDLLGVEFAEALRMMATGQTNNPAQARSMGEAGVNRVREAYMKAVSAMAKTGGLVKEATAA
jgi:hypothetical protein